MNAREVIEAAWEARASLKATQELRDSVEEAIAGLDSGRLRVAEKVGGKWITHQWLKKAVLLSFRLQDNRVLEGKYYDKVDSKFTGFDFASGGFRVVPPAAARRASASASSVRRRLLSMAPSRL